MRWRISLVELSAAAAASVAAGSALAMRTAPTFGLVGAGVLIRIPELTVLALFVGLEEQLGSGAGATASSPFVGIGAHFYQVQFGGLSIAVVVMFAAAAASALRRGPFSFRGLRLWLLCCGGLFVWSTGLALHEGIPARYAVTAATPWMLLAVASVVGRGTASPAVAGSAVRLVSGLIAGKAAIGGFTVIAGGFGVARLAGGQRIFYDSALPAVAVAALAAVLLSARLGSRWGSIVFVAAAVVAVVSFRRNVWVGGALALLISPVIARSWRVTGRVYAAAAACVVVAVVATPHLVHGIDGSLHAAAATMAGRGGDKSVEGHMLDWRVAPQLVRSHQFLGIGVLAQQPTGLLADTDQGRLYIHNEWLETWLRFGAPAALGLSLLVALGLFLACRVLARPEARREPLLAGAAVFLLMLPATLLFFPHLTTTFRWPVLCGIAAGVASRASRGDVSQLAGAAA